MSTMGELHADISQAIELPADTFTWLIHRIGTLTPEQNDELARLFDVAEEYGHPWTSQTGQSGDFGMCYVMQAERWMLGQTDRLYTVEEVWAVWR